MIEEKQLLVVRVEEKEFERCIVGALRERKRKSNPINSIRTKWNSVCNSVATFRHVDERGLHSKKVSLQKTMPLNAVPWTGFTLCSTVQQYVCKY